MILRSSRHSSVGRLCLVSRYEAAARMIDPVLDLLVSWLVLLSNDLIKFLPRAVSFRVFPAGCGPGLTVVIRVVICLLLLSAGTLGVPPVIEKKENRNKATR